MLMAINPMYAESHFFNSEGWICLSNAVTCFVFATLIVVGLLILDAKIEANKAKRAREKRDRQVRQLKKEAYQKRYQRQVKSARNLYQRDMARADQKTKVDGRIRNASGRMS